jgi:hypothetical protein
MTQRLVLATGLAVLAPMHTRADSVDTTPAPATAVRKGVAPAAVESAGNAAGVGVIKIALEPRDDRSGAVAAATAPAAPEASGTPARGQGKPRVTFEAADGGFVITVLMEGASKATLRQDGREVLVSFSHPLPNFDAQALQDQAVGLLEGVSVGYDTLLLRLTPGVSVARMDEAGGLQLALQSTPGAARAATPPGQPVTEADKEGAQRLRLLAAQIAAQSGQISGARQQFGDLLLAMPGNPEPMTGLAGLEQTTGRWRQALDLYNRALQLDPGNPSVEDAISTIQRTHGSRLRADFEYRRTDGGEGSGISIAAIEGLSGQQSFNEGWQLAYSANLAWADATKVQQPNGAVENIIGLRQRSEISLQHDALDGIVLAGSAYLTGEIPGAGIRSELPDDSGTTFLRADYRRPDWDFFQSLVDNGTRDRISVGRRQQSTQDLTARLDFGVNRYSLQGAENLATTWTVSADVRLGNLAGVHGLSIAYVLDGEYLNKIAVGTLPSGRTFDRIDVGDREVHAGVLAYAGTWETGKQGRPASYELSAGYGVDRYGKAGPILAAVVTYPIGDFDLGLRAGYVNNVGRTPGSTAIFAGSLTWFY